MFPPEPVRIGGFDYTANPDGSVSRTDWRDDQSRACVNEILSRERLFNALTEALTRADAAEQALRDVAAHVHALFPMDSPGPAPGDSVALVRAQSVLSKIKGSEDEKIGVEIVRRSLEEPLRMIAQNAGAEGSIVLAKVRESTDKNFGYNALTDVYEDLVKSGVIDPTKVTRTALQNAASIAGLLLTTECVVVEKKEEKSAPMGGPPGGGMGGMY